VASVAVGSAPPRASRGNPPQDAQPDGDPPNSGPKYRRVAVKLPAHPEPAETPHWSSKLPATVCVTALVQTASHRAVASRTQGGLT
jgi:hypothetical protein